ncbi:MAG: competence/damage-inducible protein A [Planctomycetes bacterium]|nr:competence/damage-inducible protein A [Planctomycetota bacterium]
MQRRACIIAVGNEVVHGFIVDTNSAWLAKELGELGFDVAYHLSVNDREPELTRRLKSALDEGLFVVTTGGIGPTVDDRTRHAVARALGVELQLDHDALAKLQERYAATGRKFPEGSERQTMRPAGSTHIHNAFGTASCFVARQDQGGVAVLPGIPRELEGIWGEEMRRAIIEEFGLHERWFSREVRVFGLPESDLNNRVQALLESEAAEGAILVDDAVMRLRWRVLAESRTQADEVLGRLIDAAKDVLGDLVFAEGDVSLEEATVQLLAEKGLTVACAESCTGGMIAHLMTNVSGSSETLIESAVTYSNDAKTRRLGVKPETLDKHGAVSRETAEEMARGIKHESGADLCVAVTGIAGPGGGSDDKPVGTVWLACAYRDDVKSWLLRVPGDRELVKWRTARAALNTLRLTALYGKLPETISHWMTPP